MSAIILDEYGGREMMRFGVNPNLWLLVLVTEVFEMPPFSAVELRITKRMKLGEAAQKVILCNLRYVSIVSLRACSAKLLQHVSFSAIPIIPIVCDRESRDGDREGLGD
jgi:hypothetical protein